MENEDFNNKVIESLAIQKANTDLENTKLKVLAETLQSEKEKLEAEIQKLKGSESEEPTEKG